MNDNDFCEGSSFLIIVLVFKGSMDVFWEFDMSCSISLLIFCHEYNRQLKTDLNRNKLGFQLSMLQMNIY